MTKESIQVVSPPFNGHANILGEFIRTYRDQYDIHLTITGWKNVPYKNSYPDIDYTVLAKSDLRDTDPALWTFERVNDLLPGMIQLLHQTEPKLVIYDFFSVEAKIAADILKIPSWCSDPAFIGPYDNQKYVSDKLNHPRNLEALEKLQRKFKVDIDPKIIEGLSDGFLIPSEHNLVWSYYPIIRDDFRKNRQPLPYSLVGNLRAERPRDVKNNHDTPVIYFSFGTVVMGNLWDQQREVREQLRQFVGEVAARLGKEKVRVIFATQGKNILASYPDNWEVYDTVDQIKILQRADVFLTHMGNNSFQEAAKTGVPMVGVPFFGDQIAASARMASLGLGINLDRVGNIDTGKSYDFLNIIFAEEVVQCIHEVLENEKYLENYRNLKMTADSLHGLLKSQIYLNQAKQIKYIEKPKPRKLLPFSRGDVLYGTETARLLTEYRAKLQSKIHFWEIKPFSDIALNKNDLPGLIDTYRDVIGDPRSWAIDVSSEMVKYQQILQSYKIFLNGETDVTRMCLKGLDFFSEIFGVRFLVDYFDPKTNIITAREMQHVLNYEELFKGKTTFYKETDDGWDEISYKDVSKLVNSPEMSQTIGIIDEEDLKEIWKKGIYVASASPIKIAATLGALNEIAPESDFTVDGIMPNVKAHEQLVDIEETVFETVNRLLSLQKKLTDNHTEYGLLVATCNGIKKLNDQWEDIGVVVMMDAKGRTAIAESKGVVLPDKYIKIANERGFADVTVGSVIAEAARRDGFADPDVQFDPHKYLTKGKISRKELLQDAIIKALEQLKNN
jgi:non-canonical (house-cleaning) NTP pyrophosphatase